ncbi:lipoate--protein ligase family protein [Paenibacillus sp. GD4]|jgi:octanoyl-[GcvH]:protein N-octanoyltransferase|uniref:lipoate--protein ligase family protein n=1 Tax=Paenibacillus sp. GD4 TaxID=3068890 RepID=UPI002796C784|nr:lipoate--protein ligase family protein [Paenibacillus sp. GD4]MDQ1912480.1 lipoate--protein ligase family protein [Paenibacillus sp. GD4]
MSRELEGNTSRKAEDEAALQLPGSMLLWDRTAHLEEPDVLYPFALEELLCRHVGEGGVPLVHLWRHPKAFVVGLRDSRLPYAAEAMRWLESEGYSAAVRNSGGAAVPLDPGVVNVSLVLPKRQGELDFHDDFERMYRLIARALSESDVAKGEIVGAYCPGDYDLSIGGRKFCGIAQRRQAKAYVIQAFVVVEGKGQEMASRVREFYRRASGGSEALDYPRVTENSMASLAELTESAGTMTAERFVEAVKRVVRERQKEEPPDHKTVLLPTREQVLEMADMLRARYGVT